MAFFGVEVKPGKPFSHRFDIERGRLHISHATLGTGSSAKKCFVQCNVGDKSPVLLCSLTPDESESCHLDLEFEEKDEVLFSVLGPQSVHLTGYYLGNHGGGRGLDGDDTDSYGEDIAETESEKSFYDSEDDEYEDDFIDDGEPEVYPTSPKRKSRIEKATNGHGVRKHLKKKYHVSDSDGDDERKIVVRSSNGLVLSETEDEDDDGLPINSLFKKSKPDAQKAEAKEKSNKKGDTKKVDDGSNHAVGSKRKVDDVAQDEDERIIEQKDSSAPSAEIEHESAEKPKKKKKKRVKEHENKGDEGDGKSCDAPTDDAQIDVERSHSLDDTVGNGNIDTRQDDNEVKKKKKKSKAQDDVGNKGSRQEFH